MILKQYYLGCLAHASYLLADQTASVMRRAGRILARIRPAR